MPLGALPLFIVGAGGAAGAIARYALTVATMRSGSAWPVGTLAANLLGCFLMGVVIQLIVRVNAFGDAGILGDHGRLLFGVGFCGAFTTLSALVFELSAMAERNEIGLAFAYLVVTLLGGFAVFYGGVGLVRWLGQAPAA